VTTPLVFDDQNGELRNNWRWFREKKAVVLKIEWAVRDGDEIAAGARLGSVRWNNGSPSTDLLAPRNCAGTISSVPSNDAAQWARLGTKPSQVMMYIKASAQPVSSGSRSVRDPAPISSTRTPSSRGPAQDPDSSEPESWKKKPKHQ
jgi:hypothetical protein